MNKLLVLALGCILVTPEAQTNSLQEIFSAARKSTAIVTTGTIALIATSQVLNKTAGIKGILSNEDQLTMLFLTQQISNHIHSILASAQEESDFYMKFTSILNAAITKAITNNDFKGAGGIEQSIKELGYMIVNHFNNVDKRMYRRAIRSIACAISDTIVTSVIQKNSSLKDMIKTFLEAVIINSYFEITGELIAQQLEKEDILVNSEMTEATVTV